MYIVIGVDHGVIDEDNVRLAGDQEEAWKIKEEILEEFGWDKNDKEISVRDFEDCSGYNVELIYKPELTEELDSRQERIESLEEEIDGLEEELEELKAEMESLGAI